MTMTSRGAFHPAHAGARPTQDHRVHQETLTHPSPTWEDDLSRNMRDILSGHDDGADRMSTLPNTW